jgi:hypothetical protein
MLTRNLYRLDEVKAALSWCIKSRRDKEAAFWTQELIDSELYDDLFETLKTTWLWLYGLQAIDWYLQFSAMMESPEPVSEEEMIGFACSLALCKKDASVLALASYGLADTKEPDRVSPLTVSAKTQSELELSFLRACKHGKARLAFDLARPLWVKGRMDALLNAARPHPFLATLKKESWGERAIAVAFVCMTESPKPIQVRVPDYVSTLLKEWSSLKGKARRVYAIPQDSLYFITRRGRQKNTISSRKEGWVTSLDALRGCPFWDAAIDTVVDDETKERFYETYFPDDIPDEWSLEDQRKSHGFGVLINDETPVAEKFIRKWFQGVESSVVWMGVSEALRIFEKVGFELVGESLHDSFESAYVVEPLIEAMESWRLTPVTRVKEIIVL